MKSSADRCESHIRRPQFPSHHRCVCLPAICTRAGNRITYLFISLSVWSRVCACALLLCSDAYNDVNEADLDAALAGLDDELLAAGAPAEGVAAGGSAAAAPAFDDLLSMPSGPSAVAAGGAGGAASYAMPSVPSSAAPAARAPAAAASAARF